MEEHLRVDHGASAADARTRAREIERDHTMHVRVTPKPAALAAADARARAAAAAPVVEVRRKPDVSAVTPKPRAQESPMMKLSPRKCEGLPGKPCLKTFTPTGTRQRRCVECGPKARKLKETKRPHRKADAPTAPKLTLAGKLVAERGQGQRCGHCHRPRGQCTPTCRRAHPRSVATLLDSVRQLKAEIAERQQILDAIKTEIAGGK